ncbi:hypothetical protein [Corallococcus macrosporus]|uniref:Uncharacterized protein n=1 Tax=Myxococcus fulvus (strain ATCC BAA-855 / HW-1) TaxID=483219 RepID=F8CMY9_MYXFH|nr:hypothetical protein [Corallococcus macrosporus]AEI67795.1 hypothetical protein LILAB_29570 [Corallococcus macrosporus]
MSLAERLQDSVRHATRARYESVNIPPFTAYFHPSDALVYLNYAIPDGPVTGDVLEPLKVLFLSTVTEEARRLYERAGFRFLTRMLFMIDAAPAQSAGKVTP